MPELSWQKILVVLVIALIVLGPAKLPEVMRSVGKGLREFRGAMGTITGLSDIGSSSASRAPSEPNYDEPRIDDVHPTHSSDRVSELPPAGLPPAAPPPAAAAQDAPAPRAVGTHR
jgi:TatA/E family protein of Tat protein translocase